MLSVGSDRVFKGRNIHPVIMKKLIPWAMLLALPACSSAGTSLAPSQSQILSGRAVIHAQEGTFVSHWIARNGVGKECLGSETTNQEQSGGESAYKDVSNGTQVVVKSGDGKLLGTGTLGKGAIADLSFNGSCEFPVTVANVPASDFYTIEVGSRKGITYSRKELEEKGWKVDLVLEADSIQANAKPVITPQEQKDWTAARDLTVKFEDIEANRQQSVMDAKELRDKKEICITKQQLAGFQGEPPLSEECKKLLGVN